MNSEILLVALVSLMLMQTFSATHVNVAFKKTAYLHQKHDASNALDGNPESYAMCKRGWFVVDLGGMYEIHIVKVRTRRICCGDSLNYFKVGLMNDFDENSFQRNNKCGEYGEKTGNNETYQVTCGENDMQFRYVSLWVDDDKDDLIFTYIKVFQNKGGDPVDLALNRKAHCVEPSPKWSPSNGVDGDMDSIALSNDEEYWFVVDLGTQYRVHYVQLFTRTKSHGESMSYFKVGLMNEFDPNNFQRNHLCGEYTNTTETGQNYTLICQQPFHPFKFVSLSVPEKAPLDMAFAEFEVYADNRTNYMNEFTGCSKRSSKSGVSVVVTSVDQCVFVCHQNSSKYAAITNGEKCECLDKVDNFVSTRECNLQCSEDIHMCGGKDHSSIYAASECMNESVGKDDCDDWQLCSSELVDGKCPAGCVGGGKYCQFRDCETNNGLCGNHTCELVKLEGNLEVSECVCRQGFHKVLHFNDICTDINECEMEVVCGGGECVNTEGSHTCANTDEQKEQDKKRAILGGIIGAVLAIILIIALVVYLLKRNKEAKYSSRLQTNSNKA